MFLCREIQIEIVNDTDRELSAQCGSRRVLDNPSQCTSRCLLECSIYRRTMEENSFKGTLWILLWNLQRSTMTDRSIYLFFKFFKSSYQVQNACQFTYVHCIYMFRIRICREVHISSWQTYSGINFSANDYEQVVIHVYKSTELKLLFESI